SIAGRVFLDGEAEAAELMPTVYKDSGRVKKYTTQAKGFEVIVPGNANMEHTIIPSTEAKSRKDGVTRSISPTRDGRIFSVSVN
ncbi:hypothetical protein Tco_1029096, partial [Tanacetum coccineum]